MQKQQPHRRVNQQQQLHASAVNGLPVCDVCQVAALLPLLLLRKQLLTLHLTRSKRPQQLLHTGPPIPQAHPPTFLWHQLLYA
jgi:hypothetical protein